MSTAFKPSQLPSGEYATCATLICITWLNKSQEPSALTGTHLPLGGEKQIDSKCLAQGHQCHDRDSTTHSNEQKQRA